jgi:hypothetical protein
VRGRAAHRALEDELVPRADPGTHARRVEKRAERGPIARAGSPEAASEEIMGAGPDEGIAALKRTREAADRRKSERALRTEEAARARAAEREERMAAWRQKEDRTMEMLRGLAKERFG